MPKILIHTFVLSKGGLEALPDNFRRLLLLFGHAANELQTLSRTILFSQTGPFSTPIDRSIAFGRAYIFLRMLASKVWEGHELIRDRVLSNADSRPLLCDLPAEATEALQRCKRRLGQPNLLVRLRNDHGFHYPADNLIDQAFLAMPNGEPLEYFLSEDGDANFFHASELLFTVASAQTASGADLISKFETLQDEVLAASRDLTRLFSHLMAGILENIPDASPVSDTTVEAPSMTDVRIPPVTKTSIRPRKAMSRVAASG